MSDTLNLSTTRPGLLPLNLGERRFATGIPFQILVSFASFEDRSQKTEDRKQKPALSKVEGTEIFSRLAHELESGKNLKQAFHHLNSTQQDSLREAIGKAPLAELLSLSQEGDKELFYESLLHFGVRLKSRSEFEKASVVLGLLSGEGPHPRPLSLGERGDQFPLMLEERSPSPLGRGNKGEGPVSEYIRMRAEEEGNAIVGKGDIGKRLEVLSSRLARDACDWRMIVPMIGASALGATVASSVLGRLVSNPMAGVLTRGIGARFSAGAVGYLAEFPAFAALGRVMAENSEGRFAEDLERSALAIGALKVFGAMGHQGLKKLHGFNAMGIATRFQSALPTTQFLIPQSSIFFGLLASHKLEEEFNLRPHVDGATFVTDTLASMFTMSVGSHLGHRVLGEGFQRFQREMQVRSNIEHRTSDIEHRTSEIDMVGASLRLARSTQGREIDHPSHPLLAAVGTGLATYLGTHWANAAWESAASDPSNFLLKTAALAIPAVVGMAISKKGPYRELIRKKAESLTDVREDICDPSLAITDRVEAIQQYGMRLEGHDRNSDEWKQGVLDLFDIAIDPPVPIFTRLLQSTTVESDTRILRTFAMQTLSQILSDLPQDKVFKQKLAVKFLEFYNQADPRIASSLKPPAFWPTNDSRNRTQDGKVVIDLNQNIRNLTFSLAASLRKQGLPLPDLLEKEYIPDSDYEINFPLFTDHEELPEFAGWSLFFGLPAGAVAFGAAHILMPYLQKFYNLSEEFVFYSKGAAAMTPAILCFSLLFFFAGKWEKNTLIIPNPAAKLKNKLLESDLSNKREAIAAQIERGSPHPFARLAKSSKKFRIDGVEEGGESKTRVEDLDQWLAEVERRAEAEAEAEFQTDAKKISTPKPPDKK